MDFLSQRALRSSFKYDCIKIAYLHVYRIRSILVRKAKVDAMSAKSLYAQYGNNEPFIESKQDKELEATDPQEFLQ